MYRITITWLDTGEEAVYFPVEAYEVVNRVLTLALDRDHDLLFPLDRVRSVDVVRE
jgi:hypothetical protein